MKQELLDDFNVTLEFSVKEINALLNVLAQSPFIQVVGFINSIQNQAGPQVEQAKKSLEAVEKAQKDES
jgi:hypothetical protein